MVEMGRFAKPILAMTPPDPFSLDRATCSIARDSARRFRALSDRDQHNQLQLMTMSAVDFLDQWFETDVLKATMSASGIIGTFLGVRSPGTAYVLLHHYMGEIDGAFRSWGLSNGGTGAVSEAIASAAARPARRSDRDAPVRHPRQGWRATGVVLENGDYLTANVVSSSVDPHLTFMQMVGVEHLPDEFVDRHPALQVPRLVGQGEPCPRRAPEFTCLPGPGTHLRGAISISPSVDYMERAYDEAKYGRYSRRPYIDIVIPSLTDPSVAPPGKHVMSCFVQYAPYHLKEGTWDEHSEAFGDTVIDTHRRVRAEHQGPHPAPPGADAARHRARVRPDRGQHLPGRADARAAVLPAPRAGLGAVPHADSKAVSLRLGDASRRRHHGRAGPERGAAHTEGDGS